MKSVTRLPRALKDNMVIRELDDEVLVYDTERDEAHCLNRTAAIVWEMCNGDSTILAAAARLREQLGVPVDKDLVWFSIRQLEKFNLVEKSSKFPVIARRDIVFKYAPAALVLIPAIVSITAPVPAQAASCIPCTYNFNCSSNVCISGCCAPP
jgi:hypothetical protein